MQDAIPDIIDAAEKGMTEVHIRPTYRGDSVVPTSVRITAAAAGQAPGYDLEIAVW